MLGAVFSHLGIAAMHLMAWLPLAWLRLLGAALGHALHALAWSRRHVVLTNLALCFADVPEKERRQMARRVFVHFACAWLDRSWLWHGSEARALARLQLTGELRALQAAGPVVIFAPHFVGLDAGWTALTLGLPRGFSTIYTDQSNKVLDAWILRGRQRFGRARLFGRAAGVRPVLESIRQGDALYLLPDMNFGPEESIFVPFYGTAAATVPSLSRFARLARARVVPVVTRMTPGGYQVQVLPAWTDFPTANAAADTALMNQRLQGYIDTMPAQYYWVHKRFKTRPAGQPAVY